MSFVKNNTSHVLLTLGVLFTIGGATRFLPNGLAFAEDLGLKPATETSAAKTGGAAKPADPSAADLQEVCFTTESAAMVAEDQWLFESQKEEMKNEKLALQTWEKELETQTAELQARLAATVRRRRGAQFERDHAVGKIRLSPNCECGPLAQRDGRPVRLTEKEFQCAQLLLGQMGKTVSRNQIRLQVWRHNEQVQTRTIDTHISRVRQKLGLTPENGFRLSPVYGIGYRLDHFS